ncbi:MAG: DUF2971 domain-containing protein [Burkholderiales bacterium]
MRVYHLLEKKWALDDLEKKRLKISFLEDLNDPFEFLAIETSDANVGNDLIRTRETLGKTLGILCFSRSWANPVLWSHYGDKHRGIALGFDIPDLIQGNPPWFEVSYIPDRLKCSPEELTKFSDGDMHKLLATKFEHWRYEDEIRMFASNEEKDGEMSFVPFSPTLKLVEVILGVRCESASPEIHQALGALMPKITVIQTMLDEKSFSVKQKSVIQKLA